MAASGVSDRKRSYEIDMCHGPLLRQMIVFAVPLIIAGILQLMFHVADLIVVGRLASHEVLAAVGATGSITHLLINIFIGMSVGTNVLVARYIGERNRKNISRTVHTAVLTGGVAGTVLAVFGITMARTFLVWMATPPEILEKSVLYMSIFFAGMPLFMVYNFGSAVMRAMGDTRRPFFYLLYAGIVNVLLNLFFVIVFKWDVAGVATATVIANGISVALVLRALYKMRGPCRIRCKTLRIDWKNLKEMMRIGIPAGFQASCFSISNILIQSALNTFGSEAMAGNAGFASVESFGHVVVGCISQTVISFVSQNYGGRQYGRLKQSMRYGIFGGWTLLTLFAALMLIFAGQIMAAFNSDPEVIRFGVMRARVIVPFFLISVLMEVWSGTMRGLGRSLEPTLITIFSVCIFRVIWVLTVFRWNPTLLTLLISYPVSWILNAVGIGIMLKVVMRRMVPRHREDHLQTLPG
ncbi:MAG: MATE family efflux transporter [Lentisphaerae bacterium]|nr:MATE family efflux transporter [Lentisphaerota bacterium]